MNLIGKILIFIGVFLLIIGLVFIFFGDWFSWFGNLPGDFKIRKENFSFYAPFTSMLIISILITIIVNIIGRLLK